MTVLLLIPILFEHVHVSDLITVLLSFSCAESQSYGLIIRLEENDTGELGTISGTWQSHGTKRSSPRRSSKSLYMFSIFDYLSSGVIYLLASIYAPYYREKLFYTYGIDLRSCIIRHWYIIWLITPSFMSTKSRSTRIK